MMRSAAAVGVVVAAAMTVGTMSTLAAWAGAVPTLATVPALPTDASVAGTGAGVRVTISDDTRSAHSGDLIDYTVRVDNDSSTPYPDLEVYHLVPPGFQLVDSSPSARQEDRTMRWTANVPAGGTAVFTDQVMAGTVEEYENLLPHARDAKPATQTQQFTSTACARSSSTGPALACGTVREQLTDGPGAVAGVAQPTKHWQPGVLGIAVVVALYAGSRAVFRKRTEPVDEG